MRGGRFRRLIWLASLWLCAAATVVLLTVWVLTNWYDIGAVHSLAKPTGSREHVARTKWLMFSHGRAVWCASVGRWAYADDPESRLSFWSQRARSSTNRFDSWGIGSTPTGGFYLMGFGFDWFAWPAKYVLLGEQGWEAQVPLWFPTLLLLIPCAIVMYRRRRLRDRLSEGLCARCGYDLRQSATRCPECGTANAQSALPQGGFP